MFDYYVVQVSKDKQEFAMAITSLSDSIGISISGFLAIPLHNLICQLPKWEIYKISIYFINYIIFYFIRVYIYVIRVYIFLI